jgi:penicillin-binding protein 1C
VKDLDSCVRGNDEKNIYETNTGIVFMKKKIFLWAISIFFAVIILLSYTAVMLFTREGTPPPAFQKVKEDYNISDALLLDRYSQVIHELRVDTKGRRLEWTGLSDVSPALISAVIHAEDSRFYRHHGVDWQAVGAAAFRRLTGGKARGASTITMQLAARLQKDLRPRDSRRSFREKWRQMQYARHLEKVWTKEEILEGYLNLITFRGEIQGIAAASRGLFDKEPSGLNENESLILASLIPSTHTSLDRIAVRAYYIGSSLGGQFSYDEIKALVYEKIGRPYTVRPQIAIAPHVARMLLKESGQRVKTTLDGKLQERVYDILNRRVGDLKTRNVHDGAVLVVENATGDILAYVGNSGQSSSAPHVDGIRAVRQAGSTLKPFLYELAIERRLLTAASIVEDAPLQIATPTGLYIPENYGNNYLGPVSVRTALSSSLNTPAVRSLLLVGVESFVERLKQIGFESIRQEPDYYGFSAALGSIDISLYELVNAYRTIANGGIWSEPQLIPGTRKGKPKEVMSRDAAYIISSILADRESRSATFGLENFLSTRFWTAVKTGTSKDMRDNWCIGYSEKYTVGVWIGNFSGEPMWNVSGISGAAPVWMEIMNILNATVGSRAPKPTPGVLAKRVQFKNAIEPERQEWFIKGSEPEIAVALNTWHEKPSIIYPAGGSIITLDPDIPEENQRISFQAQPHGRKFMWFINDKSIFTGMKSSILWKPERGNHILSISDKELRVLDSVTFIVR